MLLFRCRHKGAARYQVLNTCSTGKSIFDAKLIQNALGIESDEVANYCFPRTWPKDREQRARIIGDWLRAEVRYLA